MKNQSQKNEDNVSNYSISFYIFPIKRIHSNHYKIEFKDLNIELYIVSFY